MRTIAIEQGTKEWHDSRMCKVTGTKLKSVMGTAEARRSLIAELIAEEATEQSKAFVTTAEMERGNAEEIFAIRAYEAKTGKKVERVGMCVHDEHDWIALSPDGLIKDEAGKYSEATEVKCPDSKKAILYRIENIIPMAETGLLSKYTKAEMLEVLEKRDIPHNPKALASELETLLPADDQGKPASGAPFLGIPSEYKWQVVHYFLVNNDLKKLHFLIYDARFINEDAKLYTVEVSRDNEILQEAVSEAMEALLKFRADWLAWKEIVLPTEF